MTLELTREREKDKLKHARDPHSCARAVDKTQPAAISKYSMPFWYL